MILRVGNSFVTAFYIVKGCRNFVFLMGCLTIFYSRMQYNIEIVIEKISVFFSSH